MILTKALYGNNLIKWLIVNDDYSINEGALIFINYLYSQNYSVNTIETYLRDLKLFLQYLQKKDILIGEVRPINISQYIDYLQGHEQEDVIDLDKGDVKSASTINRYLSSLATFYRSLEYISENAKSPFTYYEGVAARDMYKSILSHTKSSRVKRRSIKIRSKGSETKQSSKYKNRTLKRLFSDEIEEFRKGFKSFRDKLIFDVLYETGMRIGELLALTINDYTEINSSLNFGQIYIIKKKDNRDTQRQQKTGNRDIVVTMSLLLLIEEYITVYRPYVNNENYIFVTESNNSKGRPLSRKAVEKNLMNVPY